MKTLRYTLIVCAVAALMAGCQRIEPPIDEPIAEPVGHTDEQPAGKPVHLTAYINVTSGCQEPTVELVRELDEQYDAVEVEMVDFGSTEGAKRWREDGLQCEALLFDGSPVVRIPDGEGGEETVVFYFPAGFSWTHDDLRRTFEAIEAGEADILSEEEARKALAPREVDIEVSVKETDEGAQIVLNGEPAFTITQTAGGQEPAERAEAAKESMDTWFAGPVHPTQLAVIDAEKGWSVVGEDTELVRVYPADAEAAQVEPGKKFAAQWMAGIKGALVAAARSAGDAAEDTDAGGTDAADATGTAAQEQ